MKKIDAWERRTVVYRRLFHKYPEPGWLTFFATIFIAEHLEKAGFKVLVGREILKDEKRWIRQRRRKQLSGSSGR